MANHLCTQLLIRASRASFLPNGTRSAIGSIRRRTFADVASDDMTLPLKGYKVLDLTRVLAGVCIYNFFRLKYAYLSMR